MDYYDTIREMRLRTDTLNGFIRGVKRDNSVGALHEVEELNQKMAVLARVRRELALYHYANDHPGPSQDCDICTTLRGRIPL